MDQTSTEKIKKRTTRVRTPRNIRKDEGTKVSKEAEDLQTHVEICALRYEGIQNQMNKIDERFDKIESEIKEMKSSSSKGFAEIKELIEKRNNSSHTAIITASGTIIVALITFLGYLLTHLPK